MKKLPNHFFNRDASQVAISLLGKLIYSKDKGNWLSAQIIETESYYIHEKGSHASLGKTKSREALFMPPGTIYMYYARGCDSLNISCKGKGNAVLIKSAIPFINDLTPNMVEILHKNNPRWNGERRKNMYLCSGQTLVCKSLGITVTEWNKKVFDPNKLYIADNQYTPKEIIQTTRLGIPPGRDEHLMQRFIDLNFVKYCTKNPLSLRIPPKYKILK